MEQLKHECGVAMVRLRKPLGYYEAKYGTWQYGLQKLYLLMEKQHNRGQEGAGLACVKMHAVPGEEIIYREREAGNGAIEKIFGNVTKKLSEFSPEELQDINSSYHQLPYAGEIYMGHLRYSTTGKRGLSYVHPFMRRSNWKAKDLCVCANFNMTNVPEIFESIASKGQHPRMMSDTYILLEQLGHRLDRESERCFQEAMELGLQDLDVTHYIEEHIEVANILRQAAPVWDGGYVVMGVTGSGETFCLRDPWGIRPAYWYADEEVMIIASERPVIQTTLALEAEQVRELRPGEALLMRRDGTLRTEQILPPKTFSACSFERIYFSRGNDGDIYKERKALGRLLVPAVLKAIDYEIDDTVFSYIPNTAEVAYYGMVEELERIAMAPLPSPQGGILQHRPGCSNAIMIERYKTAYADHYKLLHEYSNRMRSEPTEAEKVLWECVRNKKLGYKFRRQHIIGDCIVDFICIDMGLVIEVDGHYHDTDIQQELDDIRTEFLQKLGYEVLRFTNDEVIANIDEVLARIEDAIRNKKTPHQFTAPLPSPQGGKPQLPSDSRNAVSPLGGTEGGPGFGTRIRAEKVVWKDIKMRTFIAEGNSRNDLAAHVYDISYDSIRRYKDNLVVIDDSIVRGTTLRESIIRILDRLHPKRIVIVSSSPQVRYPDFYGIDMSGMDEFIAFRAAVAMLKERHEEERLLDIYRRCKAQRSLPKEAQQNYVREVYAPFTQEEIARKMAEMLRPEGVEAEIKIVYQTLEGLHEACPDTPGDWYFSGHYPTPGGVMRVNEAYIQFYEKNIAQLSQKQLL